MWIRGKILRPCVLFFCLKDSSARCLSRAAPRVGPSAPVPRCLLLQSLGKMGKEHFSVLAEQVIRGILCGSLICLSLCSQAGTRGLLRNTGGYLERCRMTCPVSPTSLANLTLRSHIHTFSAVDDRPFDKSLRVRFYGFPGNRTRDLRRRHLLMRSYWQ